MNITSPLENFIKSPLFDPYIIAHEIAPFATDRTTALFFNILAKTPTFQRERQCRDAHEIFFQQSAAQTLRKIRTRDEKSTALEKAVIERNPFLFEPLLLYRAKSFRSRYNFDAALRDLASLNDLESCMKIIEYNKASLKAFRAAVDIAVDEGHVEMVQRFLQEDLFKNYIHAEANQDHLHWILLRAFCSKCWKIMVPLVFSKIPFEEMCLYNVLMNLGNESPIKMRVFLQLPGARGFAQEKGWEDFFENHFNWENEPLFRFLLDPANHIPIPRSKLSMIIEFSVRFEMWELVRSILSSSLFEEEEFLKALYIDNEIFYREHLDLIVHRFLYQNLELSLCGWQLALEWNCFNILQLYIASDPIMKYRYKDVASRNKKYYIPTNSLKTASRKFNDAHRFDLKVKVDAIIAFRKQWKTRFQNWRKEITSFS